MDRFCPTMSETALSGLIAFLRQKGYQFVAPTPATHRRVNGRSENDWAECIEDVFGWSRPFEPRLLPEPLFQTLRDGDAIVEVKPGWRSLVRASSIDEDIFLHSAFPTDRADSVFFGPDTYRFARAIKANLSEPRLLRRALDLGCGSGAGGIILAKNSVCQELVLTDINPVALQLARVNADAADVRDVKIIHSDLFDQVEGNFDLIVANPPYLNDPLQRTYRHGGGTLGSEISVRIAFDAKDRLAPGGSLLLYTGSPIVAGIDQLKREIEAELSGNGLVLSYEEIDPDVFGEELETETYNHVDRIAAVVLTAQRL